eukprot:4559771-Prymnesium_polylepis.1
MSGHHNEWLPRVNFRMFRYPSRGVLVVQGGVRTTLQNYHVECVKVKLLKWDTWSVPLAATCQESCAQGELCGCLLYTSDAADDM